MEPKNTLREDAYTLEAGDAFYIAGEKHIVEVVASHHDRLDEEWCIMDSKGKTFWESEFPPA